MSLDINSVLEIGRKWLFNVSNLLNIYIRYWKYNGSEWGVNDLQYSIFTRYNLISIFFSDKSKETSFVF